MQEIRLPWPPSLNSHKAVVRGRMILSKKGRDYIKNCDVCVSKQKIAKYIGDLSVTVKLYPPDKRRRDIDNYLKAIFDSLTYSGVWGDDSQIKILNVQMLEQVKGGSALVYISGH